MSYSLPCMSLSEPKNLSGIGFSLLLILLSSSKCPDLEQQVIKKTAYFYPGINQRGICHLLTGTFKCQFPPSFAISKFSDFLPIGKVGYF